MWRRADKGMDGVRAMTSFSQSGVGLNLCSLIWRCLYVSRAIASHRVGLKVLRTDIDMGWGGSDVSRAIASIFAGRGPKMLRFSSQSAR